MAKKSNLLKEINGSGRNNSIKDKKENIQVMSTYSTKYEMTLTTEFIEDKTNEIPIEPKLLSRLNLENIIITFDIEELKKGLNYYSEKKDT